MIYWIIITGMGLLSLPETFFFFLFKFDLKMHDLIELLIVQYRSIYYAIFVIDFGFGNMCSITKHMVGSGEIRWHVSSNSVLQTQCELLLSLNGRFILVFGHYFASQCKIFKIPFLIPRRLQIKQRYSK